MVGKYMNMDFGTMDLGELMEDAIGLLKKHKIAIEPDITLLARSMGDYGRNIEIMFSRSEYDTDIDFLYVCEYVS